MLLYFGDISKLKGKPWFLVELRSEKTIENTMRRLVKAVPGIFRNEAVEMFLPILKRDLDVFEMSTGCYVFVRSSSFQGLLRLKSITGVVSLVTEGDCNRPNKAIQSPDDFVQRTVIDTEKVFETRSTGIQVGSFVRIIDGETRDYCGHVSNLHDGVAVVRIDLKTKRLLVETPVRNLLDFSHVPVDQRVFYYCPLISELVSDAVGNEKLIAEDLDLQEDWMQKRELDTPDTVDSKKYSRQRTVTALVKRLVIVENVVDPLEIAQHVVISIKKKEIKTPKNLFIVYCIIKDNLRKYFSKQDSSITNYRDVIRKKGRKYKFSAEDILEIDPELGVPISTIEICKDGRSREARQIKKNIVSALKPTAPKKSKKQTKLTKVKTAKKVFNARKLRSNRDILESLKKGNFLVIEEGRPFMKHADGSYSRVSKRRALKLMEKGVLRENAKHRWVTA